MLIDIDRSKLTGYSLEILMIYYFYVQKQNASEIFWIYTNNRLLLNIRLSPINCRLYTNNTAVYEKSYANFRFYRIFLSGSSLWKMITKVVCIAKLTAIQFLEECPCELCPQRRTGPCRSSWLNRHRLHTTGKKKRWSISTLRHYF